MNSVTEISPEVIERVKELAAEREANREPLPEGHDADVLDFFKGMRFIRGHQSAELAKKRQVLRTEEGRLEMIRQREIMDKAGPPEVA